MHGMGEDLKLLRPRQVAEMLGVHPARVYEWIDAGLLEAHDMNKFKGGNRYLLIPRSAVTAMLEITKVEPPKPVAPRYKF